MFWFFETSFQPKISVLLPLFLGEIGLPVQNSWLGVKIALNAKNHAVLCALAIVSLFFSQACSPPSRHRNFAFRALSISDKNAAEAWSQSAQIAPPTELAPNNLDQVPVPIFQEATATYWDVSLDEVVRIAMTNSQVLRDLGGRLVSQPNQAVTEGIAEINRSDPRAGIDAALSAFDANLRAGLNYSKTENGLRAPIIGSSIDTIQQQRGLGSVGFNKIGQSGTRYSVTHGTIFDADNVGVPPNRLGRAYDTFLAFEGRHPLARGGGRTYNAVAGPNSPFGTYNGYWIASARADIVDDELRIAVRDYLYNVVRAYWLLRFAYDSLEARKNSMDIAEELLQIVRQRREEGIVDDVAVLQAEEKYLAAQQLYENNLAGAPERIIAGILGPNGSLISGTELGVRPLERRLRLLIGLPNGCNGLMRPVSSPAHAPVHFDYSSTLVSALTNRPELLRQGKVVEIKRMEWLAARNLRMPTLDLVGSYRIHGFGGTIFGDSSVRQDNSVSDFLRLDMQDLAAGVEMVRPAGNRLALTAERNAVLSMVRESSILDQQKLEISYEVQSAVSEVERALRTMERSAMRLDIAYRNFEGLKQKFEDGLPIPKEALLDAQKGIAELEMAFAISRVDYSISIASLQLARGTLLSELEVHCGDVNAIQ